MARWTRWAVIVLAAGTLLLQVLALVPGITHIRFMHRGEGPLADISGYAHSLLVLLSLWQLIRLLGNLERGEYFSAGVTRRLRAFALLMLAAALIGSVSAAVIALGTQHCLPGHHCRQVLPFDMRTFWTLIISLVFFLVARVLDEARRIDEDNQQII